MAHSLLKNVPSRNEFWLADGTSLKNLKELALALQDMDETTFRRHVNQHKNDFHSWVRDVHQDRKLAGTLLKIQKKEHAFNAVQKRVQELLKPEKSLPNLKLEKSLPNPDVFSQWSWYQQPIIWATLVVSLLAVVLVSTLSQTSVTGAAVSEVMGRGVALLGITLLVSGILFIVAGVKRK